MRVSMHALRINNNFALFACSAMRGNKSLHALDYVMLGLPWLLFLIPFQLFPGRLIESMTLVSVSLAAPVLLTRRAIPRTEGDRWILYSMVGAIVLYMVFLAGGLFARFIGMWNQVMIVYRATNTDILQLAGVLLIGFSEEAYWRGYVQGYVIVESLGLPWWLSVLPYSLVHITSGMPLLALAAVPVGLVMGAIAERHGIIASGLSHAIWLYLVLYILPIPSTLTL